MMSVRIFWLAFATIFLSGVIIQHAEGGHMKKLIKAYVLLQTLKPRFVPIPLPVPFKIKIKKGEKIVPYPVKSYDMYGGGGGYGGMGGGGGYDW